MDDIQKLSESLAAIACNGLEREKEQKIRQLDNSFITYAENQASYELIKRLKKYNADLNIAENIESNMVNELDNNSLISDWKCSSTSYGTLKVTININNLIMNHENMEALGVVDSDSDLMIEKLTANLYFIKSDLNNMGLVQFAKRYLLTDVDINFDNTILNTYSLSSVEILINENTLKVLFKNRSNTEPYIQNSNYEILNNFCFIKEHQIIPIDYWAYLNKNKISKNYIKLLLDILPFMNINECKILNNDFVPVKKISRTNNSNLEYENVNSFDTLFKADEKTPTEDLIKIINEIYKGKE